MSVSGPMVSLIVIAHNERRRATDVIRSILDQETTSATEVIFVDDGSTDDTAGVAADAAAGDARFRLISLPSNVGRGAARAAGLKAAAGSIVGFVDADITLPPDWLERCLAELPGNAAVSGIAIPDGDVAVVARVSGARPRVRGGSMPITGNNVLFDRSVFIEFGFDERDRLGEDFRLANRLLRAGHSLRRVPGLTVHHMETKSYGKAIRWRFENGVDAAGHPREFGRIRMADVVWLAWLASWLASVGGAVLWTPWWLGLGVAATAGAGIAHVVSRFDPRPVVPFLVACLANIPLMAAYLIGRTVGIPRLFAGR